MSGTDAELHRGTENTGGADWDMIYLCACAVNGAVPEKARVDRMDQDAVYRAARRHMLTAAAAHALASAGVRNPAFLWAKEKAVRTARKMDADQTEILERLESAGIRYMPLKGAVLKDRYPAYGIREMSDRDILIDADRAKDVRDIMLELGYSAEYDNVEYHDCYRRPPAGAFEMHRRLTGPTSGKAIYSYYLAAERLLRKDAGNAFGFHLGDEDFYVFLTAHEYKHFSTEGTGLRSLLDTYVFLKSASPDMDYVEAEAKKLGIGDFERLNRSLALHLFGGGALTERERSMLDYVLSCGTYGNQENFARNLLEREGRKGYFLSRLTLPYDTMREMYPVLKKAPALYPFCWAYRLLHALFRKRERVAIQLKTGLSRKEKPRL